MNKRNSANKSRNGRSPNEVRYWLMIGLVKNIAVAVAAPNIENSRYKLKKDLA